MGPLCPKRVANLENNCVGACLICICELYFCVSCVVVTLGAVSVSHGLCAFVLPPQLHTVHHTTTNQDIAFGATFETGRMELLGWLWMGVQEGPLLGLIVKHRNKTDTV
jgi:hypothetical protein